MQNDESIYIFPLCGIFYHQVGLPYWYHTCATKSRPGSEPDKKEIFLQLYGFNRCAGRYNTSCNVSSHLHIGATTPFSYEKRFILLVHSFSILKPLRFKKDAQPLSRWSIHWNTGHQHLGKQGLFSLRN